MVLLPLIATGRIQCQEGRLSGAWRPQMGRKTGHQTGFVAGTGASGGRSFAGPAKQP